MSRLCHSQGRSKHKSEGITDRRTAMLATIYVMLRFILQSRSAIFHRAMLLILALSTFGCATGPTSTLELSGNPKGNASYTFRDIFWRSNSQSGAVEFVGYGLIPFINEPYMRDFDPHWPPRGYVTMRILAVPAVDRGDAYQLTILGPSTNLGPGDDEVLTGTIDNASIDTGEHDTRLLHLRNIAIRSRNKPDLSFTLSGTIIAKPASDNTFEREYRQFNTELSYRGPAPTTHPVQTR